MNGQSQRPRPGRWSVALTALAVLGIGPRYAPTGAPADAPQSPVAGDAMVSPPTDRPLADGPSPDRDATPGDDPLPDGRDPPSDAVSDTVSDAVDNARTDTETDIDHNNMTPTPLAN